MQRTSSGFVQLLLILLIAFVIRTFGYGLYRVPTGSMETTMLVGELFFSDKFSVLFSPPQRKDIIAFNDPLYPYAQLKLMRLFQTYVWGPSNWTKRVIGVPGDTVRGMIEDGLPVVYVNGEKLDDSHTNRYPLIGVIKDRSLLKVSQAPSPTARYNAELWSFKSYDPASSFHDQPFYAIDVDRVIRTDDGDTLVRLPRTPLRSFSAHAGEKKQYWDGSDEFYVELGPNQYWAMGDNRLNSHDSRVFGPLDGNLIHGTIRYRLFSIDTDESWLIVDLLKNPVKFWKKIRWHRCCQLIA